MADNPISASEIEFLREAARYLESPTYLMKLADAIGEPLQKVAQKVVSERIVAIGNKALQGAMSIAVDTVVRASAKDQLEEAYHVASWTGFWHRLAVTATGGLSWAFGVAGLAIELPVTTGIMFRSIAAIADDFGEDIGNPEVKLECISVLSHGGPGPDDDAMDASYITARVVMAQMIRDAAEFMASKSAQTVSEALARGAAPALLNFLNRVAIQFNVSVSQKFLAQSIPVIGIATGAAINNAFAGHFNTVAKYHFGIRKLLRRHAAEMVYAEYRRQLDQIREGPKKLGGFSGSSPSASV